MAGKDLKYYGECFGRLNVNRRRGRVAPHKALLLLAVIDLVERGVIKCARIELSDTLVQAFNENARKFFASSPLFQPKVNYPFYHMDSEPFWHLVKAQRNELPLAADGEARYDGMTARAEASGRKPEYSLKRLREMYEGAEIDEELFELMKVGDNRARMRVELISRYLKGEW